jgi:thiol-disulfide isomerase/thioredoxin
MHTKQHLLVLLLFTILPGVALGLLNVGDSAPNFTLPDTAWVNHQLTDYRGQVVLLNFWQHTDPSSLAELPRLSALHDDYQSHGFTALAVNLFEDMDTVVKPYARMNHNTYLRDDRSVWPVYCQHGEIPLNFVVDPNGVIRYWAAGFYETDVRTAVEQYLPDPIEHDVAVVSIVRPVTTMDSGESVAPACSVRNLRQFAETYPVRMRIGTQYDTTVVVADHAPGTTRYVEFPLFTALERGSLAVACTTELAGDDITTNDLLEAALVVNVYDVAATAILTPADTVDPGVALTPAVVVHNRGTMSDMARVRLVIGDVYRESTSVTLTAGRIDTAFLPQWTPSGPNEFSVRCSVGTARADMLPANNIIVQSVVVRPTGVADQSQVDVCHVPFVISPNPARASSVLHLTTGPLDRSTALLLFDSSGRLVRSYAVVTNQQTIITDLPAGVYVARLTTALGAVTATIVRTR